jgi:signal transduction histidine kinase
MLDPRRRPPARPPTFAPPPPLQERRRSFRRVEDRDAHEETVLLARALDILAWESGAEARLAGLLRLLAETAGARRAAVLADGAERRSAVSIHPGEDPAAAESLATWLDASANRSRVQRVASGPASISLVVGSESDAFPDGSALPPAAAERNVPAGVPATAGDGRWYALLPIPSAGELVLGFEFDSPTGAEELEVRLPPRLARHAAVALALVTEQLASEHELIALRARDIERGRFVSTVAHELRTPLTGLRGYLDLILDDKVDDDEVQREFLERSRDIVGSMVWLVGDLLELSRLESGSVVVDLEPFSVAEAATRVASSLMPIALEREIELRTVLPPRLRSATGDRRRVEQILTNLAANALKFSPPHGIVEIEGRLDGPVAIIIVRDEGAGISAEDRPKIFESFHRLAGHERITGTGLGLPIARDLARRMGGDLDVASVPDAGSAFVLALPGPAPVDTAIIAAALGRSLVEQEIALEERAVLRALGRSSRRPQSAAPPAVPAIRLVSLDPSREEQPPTE